MKRGPVGRRAGGPAGRRGSLLPPLPRGSSTLCGRREPPRLSHPLIAPRLSEVLLDCGDVPVGGLRPHRSRREGGDG